MTAAVTTQQRQPGRATWRTIVQGVLSTVLVLGLVAPAVATIIGEELGDLLGQNTVAWVTGLAAGIAAVAGALARVMAIPAVDAWLERLHLGSAPHVDSALRLAEREPDASIHWHDDPPGGWHMPPRDDNNPA